jgi:hypothetical protein
MNPSAGDTGHFTLFTMNKKTNHVQSYTNKGGILVIEQGPEALDLTDITT